MSERKVILDDEISADEFRQGAAEAGWALVAEHPQTSSTTYEQIYRTNTGTSTIHYIEDQFVKVRYALARGPDAEALAEEVTEYFAYGPDDLVLKAAEDEGQGLQYMVSWLMTATILGDQAGHARLAALIEKRLGHENAAVRRAALISVSWLEWSDFRPTVERLAKGDPAKDVREAAANLARSYLMRDEEKL